MEEFVMRIQQGETELLADLWAAVVGLIRWYANKYNVLYSGAGGVEADDLVQSGYFALVAAVDAYDPSRGGSFTGLLGLHLRNAFREAVGRKSEPLNHAVSLDVPVNDDDPDGETRLDMLPDHRDQIAAVDEAIFNRQLHDALEAALGTLPAAESRALRAKYWEGQRLEDTAAELGVSCQRAGQLCKDGLRHIQCSSARVKLERFLDDRTDFYRGMGFKEYSRSQTSPVERKLLHRERLAKLYNTAPEGR